jgi:transcriptional regulator with XRE-family HTH domain
MNERGLLKVLGTNVKQLRAQFKWSQAQLAEKVDISINFLSDIETGKKWPSPVTMVKIADIFQVEAYELLKPAHILPDNPTSVIQRYTDDIHSAIASVHNSYLLKSRMSDTHKV